MRLLVLMALLGCVAFSAFAQSAIECDPAQDIEIRWMTGVGEPVWVKPVVVSVEIVDGEVGPHQPYAVPGIHKWESKTQKEETRARKTVIKIDMQTIPPGMFVYEFRCRVRIPGKPGPWSEPTELTLISAPGKPARVVAE